MKQLARIINYARFAGTSKLLIASTFTLALAGVIGYNLATSHSSAQAADYSDNAIMRGGTRGDANYFVSQLRKNDRGDYPAIYDHYGLQTSEYTKFAQTARPGLAYKNGDIVVDGQVVATGAWSLGRQGGNGNNHSVMINDKKYYWGYNNTAFGSNSLPILAMFNDEGELDSAVINDCGNPITGNKKKPQYSCDHLVMTPDNSKENTYNFHTNATALTGASIAKVVYDFGDGSQPVERTDKNAIVSHTFKPGTWHPKVTVYVNLPGGKSKVITPAGDCVKEITIKEKPVFTCESLSLALIGKPEDHTYSFTATAHTANGAVLTSADFNFDDGTTANGVKPGSNPNTVVTTHKFAKAGTYTITADLTFNAGKDAGNPKCKQQLTIKEEPVFACESLTAQALKGDENAYSFTVKAIAEKGATLTSADFNFGDGQTKNGVKPTATNQVMVNHSYAKAGTYPVTASLTFNVGKDTNNPKCKTTVTIKEKPVFACESLTADLISKNEYSFTATATTKNGAVLTAADFNFGDGQTKTGVKPTDTNVVTVNHTYAKAGTYPITASLTFNVGKDANNKNCKTEITIKEEEKPVYACEGLTFKPIEGARTYRFTADAKADKGAQLIDGNFTYSDGQKAEGIKPVAGQPLQLANDHQFAQADTEYTAIVTLNFNVAKNVTSKKCKVSLKTPPETCTTNPNLPECKPCAKNPQAPECQPPKELPKTGPTELIGSALGLSSVAGAGYYYIGSRRNLANSLLKRNK